MHTRTRTHTHTTRVFTLPLLLPIFLPTRSQSAVTKLSEDTAHLQAALTAAENKRVAVEVELKLAVDKLRSTQQEKEELQSALTTLQGKLEAVNQICGSKEHELGGFKRRISNLEMERDGLFANLSQLQDNAKLQGQADALKLSELHSEVRMCVVVLYVYVCTRIVYLLY